MMGTIYEGRATTHERLHIIKFHRTHSQDKREKRLKSCERCAKDRSGYTEPLLMNKHDPFGTAKGGERFANELRKGSCCEPFGPKLKFVGVLIDF